jgi:hypothetical protein
MRRPNARFVSAANVIERASAAGKAIRDASGVVHGASKVKDESGAFVWCHCVVSY